MFIRLHQGPLSTQIMSRHQRRMKAVASAFESLSRQAKGLLRNVNDQEAPQKRSYFDLLKDDENGNIMRYLSHSPNAKNWTRNIRQGDLDMLYDIDGEFATFIRARFRTVIFPAGKRWECNEREDGLYISSIYLACKVIVLSGANLRMIRIDGKLEEKTVTSGVLDGLSRKLCNIESLIIREGVTDSILKVFDTRLTKLELFAPRRGKNCESYLVLQLKLTGVSTAYLMGVNVWKPIGNTLEKLCFSPLAGEAAEDEMGKIQTFCRNLKHIDIDFNRKSDAAALFKCLASYKQRLEFATIRKLSAQQVRVVVASCTKAQFNLECPWQ